MLLDNYTKQSPIIGIAGLGGGIGSYIFLSSDGGYVISRSLRFNSADSSYLNHTPSSAGNRRTWTWAAWVKRTKLGAEQQLFRVDKDSNGHNTTDVNFTSANKLQVYTVTGNSLVGNKLTSQVFRDVGAWMHLTISFNSPATTIYVNGVEVTAFDTNTVPGSAYDSWINSANTHLIGRNLTGGSVYGDFYLADVHFIDGQALTPSDFGEYDDNNVWQPIEYAGTYGTNGFHLPFSDNSTAAALGTDTSGNGNDWTPNNLSTTTGGPTSVAAASGALPVFNTTDTYGTVKGTGTRTDTNTASIVLALPMDGTNGGTSFGDQSAVIKGSGSAKTVTATSTTTSTSQYKFYGSSGSFDGTNSILTIANDADFSFGTTDFTVECWVYLTSFAGANGARMVMSQGGTAFNDAAGWSLLVTSTGTVGAFVRGGTTVSITSTNAVSLNAWGHIALCKDANGTSLYINGILGAFSATSPGSVSSGSPFYIGRSQGSGGEYFGRYQGFINDVRIYNGVAKYTSNFNLPSSTANATIAAGNDSLVDTPEQRSGQTDTGVGNEIVGNHATLNPSDNGGLTLSNGNLQFDRATASWISGRATIGMSSGKWYWEVVQTTGTSMMVGISKGDASQSNYVGAVATGWAYNSGDGNKYNNASNSAYGNTYTTNDVIGVAFDVDSGDLKFYKNGTVQNSGTAAYTGLTSGPYFPAVSLYGTATAFTNFGQRAFQTAAPAGYKALCTANLPDPTIADGSTAMDVALYTGNGSTQTVSGLKFSPGLVWIKQRNGTVGHLLYDQIRGGSIYLQSNTTGAEGNQGANKGLYTFTSDGFSVGDQADGAYGVNGSSITHAAWTWDAGSSTVTNTDGSISSQVRANASAGFSVITATTTNTATQTFGHGLNVAPAFHIIKLRNGVDEWYVYHSSVGAAKYLRLNSTAAQTTSSALYNDTAPTSSLITLGSGWNSTSYNIVCYAFSPVAGYSSFGSYTGNGSTSGPMVFTGFRPRWILIKSSSISPVSQWGIWDTERNTYNVTNSRLSPNTSNAETIQPAVALDVLSNGFKPRTTDYDSNQSGDTYIWAAFAEHPFKTSRAR